MPAVAHHYFGAMHQSLSLQYAPCDCEACQEAKLSSAQEPPKKPLDLTKVAKKAFDQLHKRGSYRPEDLMKYKAYRDLITATAEVFNTAIPHEVPEEMKAYLDKGRKMKKEKLIEEILEKEWSYFSKLNNIGGRADCQDNREDFIIMRKSQWETFNEETLLSYLEDLNSKNNPLFQKYGQMMKYNSPQEYEKVKDILENPSKNKITLIEKIMSIYMEWEKEFFKKYPIFSSMGRPLYSTEDDNIETSIETYLRGELLSYSEKTLQLYLKYILEMKEKNINLAIKNMDNLANMQGFKNSDEVEEYYKNLQKN